MGPRSFDRGNAKPSSLVMVSSRRFNGAAIFRSRKLAGLLLSRCTVLLLDEPTNHLDFETVEALADALKDFDGTIFLTSHDRTFVSRVATDIVEVKDGKVELYPDDYAGYVHRIEREALEGDVAKGGGGAPDKNVSATAAKTGPVSALDRKAQHERLRTLKNQIKTVEKQVAAFDTEKKQLSAKLEANPTSYQPEVVARLDTVTTSLDEQEARWLTLNDEIETLTAQE